ncbi:MAG: ribosome-associated translation inhibitor RaiA [Candidatus Bipolaricaulis sp.]|nr:ribosome-associated translation inhibitor RaiA [Candidatus Bipolaricaulis sp.]MDD5219310.1 ribosome-associated translation inhibitor RaiA [Candidatus Bipolaricaulis sp.]MDD5647065.1 ribosome-associated translation inhibitor RaiA [Candidatus Bipolaricaulis sp.]
MKIKIAERHTGAGSSEALRAYVVDRAESLERFFDRIISVDVILTVEKERQIADFHAHLVNRKVITAREESTDMYGSVDKAVERLRRQLVKFKDQLNDVREHGEGSRSAIEAEGATGERRIVRKETFFYKPMTPEEASMQLDAIEKGFLVFINSESDEVAIVYHRRDGSYGLIEPRR